MKQLVVSLLSVGVVLTASSDAVTSAYHVKVADGDVLAFATSSQTEYPAAVGDPAFWLDCSNTNGWEFANGRVTKACSRVGDRYLTTTKSYLPVTTFAIQGPEWSVDPEIGKGVLDFGAPQSKYGLYFDPCAPEDAPNKTNVLWNIRTVISVIETSAGGGFFLGGGGSGGYGWHRGGAPDTIDNPYLYAEYVLDTSHSFAYARYARYWVDDVPNDPTASGFSGGWAVTALEPEPEPNSNMAGYAWGLGINDARQSQTKRSGGFKVAEMLIYDRILTKAETDAVRAYLNRKWLKRTWRGQDGHAGLSWLWAPYDNSKVELNVTSGDTLETDVIQAGRAQKDEDPRLVKTGAGALVLANAANYNGTVELKEGSVLVKTPEVAADEMPKGLVARFDASDATAVETDETGAVTKWTSSVANAKGETYCLIPPAANRAPTLTASPLGEGKPVVDFGFYASSNARYFLVSVDGSTTTSIKVPRTILAVVDRNPGSYANIANDMFAGYNTGVGSIRPSWFGICNATTGSTKSSLGISQTDGPSYVNGVRHDPTNGVYHGSYSVVAKTSPGRTSLLRVGCGEGSDKYTSGGGLRLAELLVFNRPLTDREIRDLSDKLSVKWFGRHTDAYRAEARTTADIQKLDVSAEAVVKVEEGATVRVGSLGLGAKLVKEGAGTLEIERLRGKFASTDKIEIREGEVKFVGPSDPGEDAVSKLADNPSLHLDAADTDKMLFNVVDGEKRIVKWYDENLRDAAFQPESAQRPFLNETDLQNGHPVIDFGPLKQSEGGRYFGFGRSYESVRAAYVVFMQASDQGSATVIGSSTLNGDNGYDRYDFVRQTSDKAGSANAYFNHNNGPCYMVSEGEFYTNGVPETAHRCRPPLQEFRLVEVHTLGGAHASGLGGDRVGSSSYQDTIGGCRIGEVVLYERELTAREKIATRNYLMKKWFNAEPQALPDPEPVPAITNAAEIVVDEGATRALTVADEFSAERLTGSGTLTKDGAGTLTVADVSGFAGTLAVAEGTVRLTGAAPDETATLVTGGRILHLDASQGLETETNRVVDVCVKEWKSVLNDGWTAVPFKASNGTVNPPDVIPGGLAGRSVVEMGAGVKQALEFQKDGQYAYLGNIHSIFWVIGSQNGGGFLMGGGTNVTNGTRYPFHRYGSSGIKASDCLLHTSHSYEPLRKQATWHLNGAKIAPATTCLSGGWDLLSMTIPESTPEACNYVNAQGLAFDGRSAYQNPKRSSSYDGTIGNQRLAEVIVYDRELTDEERVSNEHYLQRKWRLGVRGAVGNDATLALAADATLDCGGVSQYFAAVGGEGTVVNGTLETAKVTADAASAGLDVQGTFVIPEALTVEVRNLSATGDLPMFIPILKATTYVGRENLATAVFTGESRPGGANQYRLVIRRGILGAALPTGALLILR